jgi:hypothetical protein
MLLQGGAVAACIAAVDAVQVKPKFNKLIVQGLQSPELLIGLASVAVLDRGIGFHLRFNEVAAELDGAWPENLPVPIEDAGVMTLALSAHCHSIAEPTRCARGADVTPSVWQDADSLAARTYVPSTSQSRERGAGAGLSDND